jgi:prepilin-type N-terminal cleavage/methylation domain-containing protein
MKTRAFTLIEIMIVVGIIGLIMAAGAPTLYHALRREGYRKTVADIMEVCEAARARAILQGEITQVEFRPLERFCQVAGGGGGMLAHRAAIDENVVIEMLDVNLREYKDADVVYVRFFPNGTSDEMTLILRSDKNEWRKIALENTTALASLETDPKKWR